MKRLINRAVVVGLILGLLMVDAGIFAADYAKQQREYEEVQMLVDSKDVDQLQRLLKERNIEDGYGYTRETLLMLAAEAQNLAMVEALLAAGAFANNRDHHGMTALHHALQGHPNYAFDGQLEKEEKAVCKVIEDETRLPKDIANLIGEALYADSTTAIVRRLLDAGAFADLAVEDMRASSVERASYALPNEEQTPLMMAARLGNADVVNMILAKNVDPNAVDKEGNTALLLADGAKIMALLIDAGADIDARDNNGQTALIRRVNSLAEGGCGDQTCTCQQDDLNDIMFLLNKHADVNVKNNEGLTVFDYVVDFEDEAMAERVLAMLMKAGGHDLEYYAQLYPRNATLQKMYHAQMIEKNTILPPELADLAAEYAYPDEADMDEMQQQIQAKGGKRKADTEAEEARDVRYRYEEEQREDEQPWIDAKRTEKERDAKQLNNQDNTRRKSKKRYSN